MIKGLGTNRLGQNNIQIFNIIDFSYKNVLKPQFYGITYFSQLNQKLLPPVTTPSYNINRVFIELRQKDGGLKKIWWYSQDSDNPIEGAQFELTQKGSGGCQIKFAYLDIPIEAQDYINIIVAGDHLYRGFVENDVDISYPVATAKGYNQRLNEVLYSYDYTLATDPIDIIEDVITASSSFTGVTFRSDLIDLGIVDPIIVEYVDEFAGKIIEDLISRANNRFWGVNVNNEFYIQEYNTGSIDYKFYNFDGSIYEKADFKKDYSKIKATEYTVYQKDDVTSGMNQIGTVGDSTNITYPQLDIVNKLRVIQNKVTASELTTQLTALNWAYLKLQNEVDLKTQIAISGINIEEYRPAINDRILAEDDFKSAFITVNDTQSISGWSNSALITEGGLENNDCVRIFFNPASVSILTLSESKNWYKQDKIGFYMKGTAGKQVMVRFSNDLVTFTDFTVSIQTTNYYDYYSFAFPGSFKYIQFENVDSSTFDCCVYKIIVLCYDKRQYTESIVNVKYTFDPIKIVCDIQAGSMDEQESDRLFAMEKKIRILETINTI